MIGPWEIGGLVVLALLIFGTGKISGIGKSLGTAIRDFRESVKSDDEPEEEPIESKPKEAGNSND
jgi:sec-independent protein translocase protein TatA